MQHVSSFDRCTAHCGLLGLHGCVRVGWPGCSPTRFAGGAPELAITTPASCSGGPAATANSTRKMHEVLACTALPHMHSTLYRHEQLDIKHLAQGCDSILA